ncbi:hypothetical protein RRG08_008657 [Elysia crispata]|uniref:Uncharacterized protein n=1 Tax=Elysia crispata TaxID=231223 RepID=A0AAE1DTP3_9GAST|nr:hypothetical protein RRG08_008657 [Elysia crispata]
MILVPIFNWERFQSRNLRASCISLQLHRREVQVSIGARGSRRTRQSSPDETHPQDLNQFANIHWTSSIEHKDPSLSKLVGWWLSSKQNKSKQSGENRAGKQNSQK